MTAPSGSDAAPLAAVYILAGGASRRFGSDKARFELDGKPLIRHAADLATPYAEHIVVVARSAGQYDDLGLATIGDIHAGLGPIGGLETALRDATHPSWFALIACDWIHIRGVWLDHLLAKRAAAHAVVFSGDRFEPTLGLYHTSIASLVDHRISDGALDMQSLLAEADTIKLPLPADWGVAVNVNRRSDAGGGE